MKSAVFDYFRPANLAAAITALQQSEKTTAIISGGQSLIPMLNLRVAAVDVLVDVSRLEEMKRTTETRGMVRLGAATSHGMIEDGRTPDPSRGLMPRVAAGIAYRAIRNFGTIGGSVALADPAADWPVCLMALGASVVVAGPAGTRTEPVADFIQGAYATTLAPGEIVTAIDIPRLDPSSRWGFVKLARKSGAFADSLAVVVERGTGGPVSVALGGTKCRARLLTNTAAFLEGSRTVSETGFRQLVATEIGEVDPESDDYQRRCHAAAVTRALRQARH